MMSESFSFWGSSSRTACKDFSAQAVLLLCLSPRPGELGAMWLVVFSCSLGLFPVPLSEDVFGLCFVG